jgi:exopolyphosphatase/guanosine-5'-triphosphate,3'-diphosphate pyrophosphatase
MLNRINHGSRIVGFMDIGTNAARLMVVRINPNLSYSLVTRQRETVRLGEGEFVDQKLHPEAVHRTSLVCRHFAELARSYGAEEIVAVATAASREAKNQDILLRRLRREAKIDLRIISGKEEARLIYLGVSRNMRLDGQKVFVIDIGGGSTEIIVGDQRNYKFLDTMKLGAIRLTTLFFKNQPVNQVSTGVYNKIRDYVRNTAVHAIKKLNRYRIDLAVGTSGTIMNLAQIAARQFFNRPLEPDDSVSYPQIKQVIKNLCSLSLTQRRKVPGINPDRADIIIAGSAIIDVMMQELKLQRIYVSDRSLRDGLLVNYLARFGHAKLLDDLSLRQRSVLLLGRNCQFDEMHARVVVKLALELFDSAKNIGLHNLGSEERELLEYAALLHDIGVFVSFDNHQAHSYYLINNADLLGFDKTEIQIIAHTARFHRKGFPNENDPEFFALDEKSKQIIRTLSILLRLAESLDRSHSGIIKHVKFQRFKKKSIVLEISPMKDCPLEIWGVENHQKAFRKTFDSKLIVEV